MKKLVAFAAAACSLALAAPLAAHDRDRAEEALAELVDGRIAGEPVQCINTFNNNRLRVVEHVGLVYERGDTVWIARARNANQIGHWDVPILDRFSGSRLCTTDVMRTVDRGSGMFSGVLFLDDFVPYTETGEG